jgi:phosphoribosyl 1,2-cyclic phosphodiesterase
MFEISVLASGSSGNAVLVRATDSAILIDAGLSARRLTESLGACGLNWDDLQGVLITHEHVDHTRALANVSRERTLALYANRLTADVLRQKVSKARWNFFSNNSPFVVGGFEVEAFHVPHDAASPVGFVIRSDGVSFAVATDLGHVPPHVIKAANGATAVLVESNHDADLLQNDPKRPHSVKERIRSKHGHLSNDEAGRFLKEIASPALRQVLLAHLSEDCNTPDIAMETARRHLEQAGCGHVTVACPGAGPLPHRVVL